ncbi:MAG TPA: site-specific integrase [Phycisphaerales bacterium]|nr:site-specific integrase [Phycisphaerales bacterium]
MSDNSHLSDPKLGTADFSNIADICNQDADVCNSSQEFETNDLEERKGLTPRDEEMTCSPLVDFYLANAQALNTRKAYLSDLEHFKAWGAAFPASAAQVASYLAENAKLLAVSTLKRRVAAIASVHREQGQIDPTKSALVKQVMKGIERHHGVRQKQANPLLPEVLVQIVSALGAQDIDLRDKALLLVGFYGALRGAELLNLRIEDCLFDKDGALLRLTRSKTDQAAKGRWIAIPRLGIAMCPTTALKAWIVRSGYDAGPLFRPLKGLVCSENEALSVRSLSRMIQQRVKRAGFNPKGYSSHSLRAGFVTSQVNAGVDTSVIARQTGHSSLEVLRRYDRPLAARLSTTSKGFGEFFPGAGAHKEVCDLSGQGTGKSLENGDSRVFEASLQTADIGPVDVGIDRQGFLRDAPLDPEFPEIVSNDTLSLHAVKSSSCC